MNLVPIVHYVENSMEFVTQSVGHTDSKANEDKQDKSKAGLNVDTTKQGVVEGDHFDKNLFTSNEVGTPTIMKVTSSNKKEKTNQ